MGGTAAASVGLALDAEPGGITLPAMAIAAFAAGAVWSGIAGILKLRFEANELITTIMLSYIAIFLVAYWLHGPLQDPNSPLGQTARLSREASLPIILSRTRLNVGLIIALASAALAHLFLWRTVWGYRTRVVGINLRAAANAGIDAPSVILAAFLMSGGLAGLAGFAEVAGVQHRMIENLSPGYGYTAIMVALLGQTNPLGALAAAFLFAALQVGATTMEAAAHVPSTIATIIQALVILFLIARNALPAFWRRRRAVAAG
jgi:simple sugar transport system permease protein